MAQTTDGLSLVDCKIETSLNGSVWADRSGFSNSVEVDGGDRAIGETHTASGDTPIVTKGKRAARSIKIKAVYTEGASDVFEDVRAAYEAGSLYYVRYSPKGGSTGNFMFTSDPGYIESFKMPSGEFGDGAAAMIEFTVKTAKITKSVVA